MSLLFNHTPRTFHDAPDGGGAQAPTPQPAPTQGQSVAPTIPPPPPGAGKVEVDVQGIYNSNFELTQKVAALQQKLINMEQAHAAKLAENSEKVTSYDALNEKLQSVEATLGQYKEFAAGHLKSKIDGLDDVIKGDFDYEALAENPLDAFAAITKRETTLQELQARLTKEAGAGQDGTAGSPDKGTAPSVTPYDRLTKGEITHLEYMKETQPEMFSQPTQ